MKKNEKPIVSLIWCVKQMTPGLILSSVIVRILDL